MSKIDREERIRRAKRASPLTQADRRRIVDEIRELDALRHSHPELSIRVYSRTNELLEMLDADEGSQGCDDARNVLTGDKDASKEPRNL